MREEEEPQLNIRVQDNEIYFYEEVTDESILRLNIELRKLARTRPAEILLFINSPGGDVFSGFSAMDHIHGSPVPVTTIADGLCCSAATLLLLGGHKRLVKEHAHVLIHQISSESSAWAKFEDLKDEIKNLETLMDKMVDVYRQYTELPEKKLLRMMKHDMYLSSDQCIKYGIASELWNATD
jgi:ATP-dependent protease ClpP protease subunit